MVTARKMFEELGYKLPCYKTKSDTYLVYYTRYQWSGEEIVFLLKDKEVRIDAKHVRPELVKAIYKQCEELGWL